MPRYILIFLLFFLYNFSILAQDSLNKSQLPTNFKFEDEFKDDYKDWYVGGNENYKCEIKDGKYVLTNKLKTQGRLTWNNFHIDYHEDLFVETSLYHLSGADSIGNGLIWNVNTKKDVTLYNAFIINEKKVFKIFTMNEKGDTLIQMGISENINSNGKLNKLAINKVQDTLYFYINDLLVYVSSNLTFSDGGIGFKYGINSSIAVDNMRIKYEGTTIHLIKDWNKPVIKQKLGGLENTEFNGTFPYLAADGQTLYFVRRQHPNSDGEYHVMHYSNYDKKNDKWLKAIPFDATLNQKKERPYICGVSLDKATLYIQGIYDSTGLLIGVDEISVTHKKGNGWLKPAQLKIKDYYNKEDYVNFSMSVDNKIIIMAIGRNDSKGYQDLYVSFKKGESWTIPSSLGPVVNTEDDELCSYLAADNKTLYFTSCGHPGFGEADIFVTRRLDDTWQNWTKPENLGPYINTEDWEGALVMDARGEKIILSQNDEDLYELELPISARPNPMLLLKGKVYNSIDSLPLSAEVIYENLMDGKEEGKVYSKQKNGFITTTQYNINLGLRAELKGFISENKNFDLRLDSLKAQSEIHVNLYLTPLKIGNEVKLNNVFFDANKYELLPMSHSELNRLVKLLNEHPTLAIEIEGHTEAGSVNATFQELMDLSLNRANAVSDYLIQHGINKDRLATHGYGNTKPLSIKQEENRRVTVRITKM